MARILVVDDDPFMRDSLLDILDSQGHAGTGFSSAVDALEALKDQAFDVAITDLKMPVMDGIEFLERARTQTEALPILVITAHGTVETAVEAMRRGAYDYIMKPFGADELSLTINKVLDHRRLEGENRALKRELRSDVKERPLLGESDAMRKVRRRIEAVMDSDATVLIRGESGVGKELVARAIHYGSHRAERPFLCVNCAALSAGLLESELFGHEKGAFTGADRKREGRFELADGGTLLLDEVSEIDSGLQAKLLRVLQERQFERVGSSKTRHVDVRVLATTNRNLEKEVAEGQFREDLYYRLNIVPIEIPPLRERKDDIAMLAEFFLTRAKRRAGRDELVFSEAALAALMQYHWPGNVRELENIIERAVLLSPAGELTLEGLNGGASRAPSDAGTFRGLPLEQVERLMIEDTLQQFGGHQRKTAESLGIGVRTLRDKIKKWGLTVERRAAVRQ